MADLPQTPETPDPTSALAPPVLAEVSVEGVERREEKAYLEEIRLPRDEILQAHGQSDPTFYERLRRDPQVKSTFERRRYSVISREWKVDPGGDSPLDQAAADHLREQLNAISWDRITYKMLAGLWPGYAVSECMWKIAPNGGRFPGAPEHLVELSTIKVRRAGRFRWTNGGQLKLLTTTSAQGVPMPPRKFWLYSCGADDDDEPYGLGLGHHCYWPIWFKRVATKFWAIFLERYSTGLAKGEVPAGTKEDKRKELAAALDSWVAGGKLVVTKGTVVELLQAARDSGGDFQRFIDLANADISKIILTQTMTTDDAATKAGGTVHMQGEAVVVKSDADLVNESFMSGPAAWITEWNFPGAKTPRVYRVFEEEENLNTHADRDVKLSQIGYRLTPSAFAETYGDGYEYSPPATAVPAEPSAGGPSFSERRVQEVLLLKLLDRALSLRYPNFAEEGALGNISDAIERLVADDGWRRVMGPQVDAIERLIADADSLTDFRDRLGELAKTDPTQLTDTLSRVLFAARVSGEEGADVGRNP